MDERKEELRKSLSWMLTKYPGSKHYPAVLLAHAITGDDIDDLFIRNKQIYNINKGIPSLEVHRVEYEKGGWRSHILCIRIPLLKSDMDDNMKALISCIKEDQLKSLDSYVERAKNFINNIY